LEWLGKPNLFLLAQSGLHYNAYLASPVQLLKMQASCEARKATIEFLNIRRLTPRTLGMNHQISEHMHNKEWISRRQQ